MKNFQIVTLIAIATIISGMIFGGRGAIAENEKNVGLEQKKSSQETLDSHEGYVFDKNHILHFPSGKTLSFEKGVNGINDSPQGKFSPDGKYLAYTFGKANNGCLATPINCLGWVSSTTDNTAHTYNISAFLFYHKW